MCPRPRELERVGGGRVLSRPPISSQGLCNMAHLVTSSFFGCSCPGMLQAPHSTLLSPSMFSSLSPHLPCVTSSGPTSVLRPGLCVPRPSRHLYLNAPQAPQIQRVPHSHLAQATCASSLPCFREWPSTMSSSPSQKPGSGFDSSLPPPPISPVS